MTNGLKVRTAPLWQNPEFAINSCYDVWHLSTQLSYKAPNV